MTGVLERRQDVFGINAELFRSALGETFGIGDFSLTRVFDFGDQVRIFPDRNAIFPPVQPERPARQALARIPFALAVMQQTAGREARAQAPDQIVTETALGGADR